MTPSQEAKLDELIRLLMVVVANIPVLRGALENDRIREEYDNLQSDLKRSLDERSVVIEQAERKSA